MKNVAKKKFEFQTDDETRKRMSKIKSKDGKVERVIAKRLWRDGIHYRKNYRKLPGSPDIAITKYKIAVFIDGEFWHGYGWPASKRYLHRNREYWIAKIERNIKHDQEVTKKLEEMGWIVLRFWSKKVLDHPEYYCERIKLAIRTRTDSEEDWDDDDDYDDQC